MDDEYKTLEEIESIFDKGQVDCKEILNSDEPLDRVYDRIEEEESGYQPTSAVAQQYLPSTDDLI